MFTVGYMYIILLNEGQVKDNIEKKNTLTLIKTYYGSDSLHESSFTESFFRPGNTSNQSEFKVHLIVRTVNSISQPLSVG